MKACKDSKQSGKSLWKLDSYTQTSRKLLYFHFFGRFVDLGWSYLQLISLWTMYNFWLVDTNLLCEDLLAGHLVLKHLGIHSKTLIEKHRATLNDTDCSAIDYAKRHYNCGELGRPCTARVQRESSNCDDEMEIGAFSDMDNFNLLRGNYLLHKFDVVPFPDTALLSLNQAEKEAKEKIDITFMLTKAKELGFPNWHWPQLESITWKFADTFSTRFSSNSVKVVPLKIELCDNARLVPERLCKYSSEQRLLCNLWCRSWKSSR